MEIHNLPGEKDHRSLFCIVQSGVKFIYAGNTFPEQLAKRCVAQKGVCDLSNSEPFSSSNERLELVNLIGLFLRTAIYRHREAPIPISSKGDLSDRPPILSMI